MVAGDGRSVAFVSAASDLVGPGADANGQPDVYARGNRTPRAAISVAGAPWRAPVVLRLDGSASSDPDGVIVAARWSFGDGTTGRGLRPLHQFRVAGRYRVRLTVVDDRGLAGTGSRLLVVAGCTITGTSGRDVLRGTSRRDVICGLGADRIAGGGGDDVIEGGTGNDRVDGGPGRDTVRGGRGATASSAAPERTGCSATRGPTGSTAGSGDDRLDGGRATTALWASAAATCSPAEWAATCCSPSTGWPIGCSAAPTATARSPTGATA